MQGFLLVVVRIAIFCWRCEKCPGLGMDAWTRKLCTPFNTRQEALVPNTVGTRARTQAQETSRKYDGDNQNHEESEPQLRAIAFVKRQQRHEEQDLRGGIFPKITNSN